MSPSTRCSRPVSPCSSGTTRRSWGSPTPADPRTTAGEIIASAAADPAALEAVAQAAHAFGRGMGALVNALDPDVVTLSGLALDLAARTPASLADGYTSALMRYRRAEPPPVLHSPLGPQGPLIGAADTAFDVLLTEDGLETWSRT
ncbi:ROK family protein [Actinomadura sp. GC306]|uniref:ROK family protein n=1 Tax=Actinomadura sp. GC306 TaxID=2530367 RepID=UPI001047D9EB|nr:ROK family protein [Actinomadura sp. GC306]TDC59460.1 ROK family protein [Actinomadura sp. GC306]